MISEMQKYVKIITLILVTLILVCFCGVFIKTQKITREFDFPVWTNIISAIGAHFKSWRTELQKAI